MAHATQSSLASIIHSPLTCAASVVPTQKPRPRRHARPQPSRRTLCRPQSPASLIGGGVHRVPTPPTPRPSACLHDAPEGQVAHGRQGRDVELPAEVQRRPLRSPGSAQPAHICCGRFRGRLAPLRLLLLRLRPPTRPGGVPQLLERAPDVAARLAQRSHGVEGQKVRLVRVMTRGAPEAPRSRGVSGRGRGSHRSRGCSLGAVRRPFH